MVMEKVDIKEDKNNGVEDARLNHLIYQPTAGYGVAQTLHPLDKLECIEVYKYRLV